MTVELRSTLSGIIKLLNHGENKEALERLSSLRCKVETDTWVGLQEEVEQTKQLLQFVERPYKQIESDLGGQIIEAVEGAKYLNVPFPLRVMDSVFNPSTYQFLSENFPHIRFLKPRKTAAFLNNGSFQRYEAILKDGNLVGAGHTVRKLWLGVRRAFELPEVRQVVCEAAGVKVPKQAHLNIRVMYDRCGFSMAPHTDGGNGAILTFQVNFPVDNTLEKNGTEFYERNGDKFKLSYRRPYLPNNGHLFSTSDFSWHGVRNPIPELADKRRTLVIRYAEF